MKNQIELTENQIEKCVEIAKQAYCLPQNYDTCISYDLVAREVVHSYGSFSPIGNQFFLLLRITAEDTRNYQGFLREEMTEDQRSFCDERGWLAIFETNSEKPEDWEEFTVDDDLGFEDNVMEQVKQRIFHSAYLEYGDM